LLTPLISYNSSEVLKNAIQTSDLKYSFNEHLFDELIGRGLPPLVSPTVFAFILGVSPKLITAMARNPSRYYRSFVIPKRSGGQRTILAPRTFLKAVQYYVLQFILKKQAISTFATGFVRGKGTIYNARLHAGLPFLLNVDLKDFFGSVTISQVRGQFINIGFPIGQPIHLRSYALSMAPFRKAHRPPLPSRTSYSLNWMTKLRPSPRPNGFATHVTLTT